MPEGRRGGQKPWCRRYCLCTRVKRTALMARQQAGLPWFPLIHRSPPSPGIGTVGRPARGSGKTCVSFTLGSPAMPRCNPLKGIQSRLLWGLHSVCSTPEYRVAGQSCSEFSRRLPLIYLPCQSVLKDQSPSSLHELPQTSTVLLLELE